MNIAEAKILFARELDIIKSLDKEYSFDTGGVYGSNHEKYQGKKWARVFILDKQKYSVGRITFEFTDNDFRLWPKHYKPGAYEYKASDDDFFFMLMFYFNTGKRLLPTTISYFEQCAYQIRERDYQKKVNWRLMNPPKGKNNRKALQKKSVKNIIRQLIHNMERPDYNGWGICDEI